MRQKVCAKTTRLRATVYDRVNSFLISAILVCGLMVFGMFMMWLTGPGAPSPLPDGKPVREAQFPVDDEDKDQLLEEFEKDDIVQRKFEEVIQSVPSITDQLSSVIHGGFVGKDQRNTSPGKKEGDPDPTERIRDWEIRYEADSRDEYAEQLDHFGIELGAVSLIDNRIVRVGQFTDDLEITETSRAEERETLFFSHKQSRLKRWDRVMAQGADLDFAFELVHLFPEEVTAQMAETELNYVKDQGRKLAEIEKTLFELVPDGDGWKIRVALMEFTEREEGQ